MTWLFPAFVIATTVAAGITGGVFFAFSSFVMPALRRRPPQDAVAAMQQINELAPRSLFMAPLMVLPLGGAIIVLAALVSEAGSIGSWRLGGAIAGISAFAVTALRSVPLNNELARVEPGSGELAAHWWRYERMWTRWNHVRTVAALSAVLGLTISLR